MPLHYSHSAIPDDRIPAADEPLWQHALDIYASETNKTVSGWREFTDADLVYRSRSRARDSRFSRRPVPATYGPTADVPWDGADPTRSVEAAGRK